MKRKDFTQVLLSNETHSNLMTQKAKYIGKLCKFVSVDKFIEALLRFPVEDIPDADSKPS